MSIGVGSKLYVRYRIREDQEQTRRNSIGELSEQIFEHICVP